MHKADKFAIGGFVLILAIGLWFGVTAMFAWGLQFVFGWFASQAGWKPMPFWVAFVAVALVMFLFSRGSSSK
jgi:hypothetical protein